MKITSIQRDMALKQGNFTVHDDTQSFKEKYNAGARGYKRGINADNSGNLTDKSEVAAITFEGNLGTRIGNSNSFNWILEKTAKHNVAASAFIALILAGVLRPLAIMSLPGKKDRDDKIYASGHSMASGIIGFAFSTLVTSPLDNAIDKIKKDPAKFSADHLAKLKETAKNGATKLEKNVAGRTVDALETCLKNIPDWIIAVPRAMLTIALIPPILKYVFGVEKKKKAPQTQQPQPVEVKPEMTNNIPAMQKTNIDEFAKGGLK